MRPTLSVQDLLNFIAQQGEVRLIDWSKVPIVQGLPPNIITVYGYRNDRREPVDDWHELSTVKINTENGGIALCFGPPPEGYAKAMSIAEQAGIDLSDDSADEVPA